MKYEFCTTTPYQTIRLWLYDWQGRDNQIEKLKEFFGILSCWGDFDKWDYNYMSWEFPHEYRNAVEQILNYYGVTKK